MVERHLSGVTLFYPTGNRNGYCPNHSTGVTFPDVAVTPLQYVD
jgi:hypothetical protein